MEHNDYKKILHSKEARRLLLMVGSLVVLVFVFLAGEAAGLHKARFSYGIGERYYRDLAGPHRGFLHDLDGDDLLSGNGAAGSILNIASSSLVIQDRSGAEKTVLVSSSTAIRRFRDTVGISSLAPKDNVIVIGTPNDKGEIEAKLIRVLPLPPGDPESPQASSSVL